MVKASWQALGVVIVLVAIAWLGAGVLGLTSLFAVALPCVAALIFVAGFVYRIVRWASTPVPFHIPTVCGQQRSHPWLPSSDLESPSTNAGLFGRMALEALFFRSLLRNDRAELKGRERLVYGSSRYLWLGAMLFHWPLLIILVRHLRFFTEPVLPGIATIQYLDSVIQIGLPALYLTDIAIFAALIYLLARRLFLAPLRIISLPADYFALFLLIAIAASGILMRHVFKVDLSSAKAVVMGLVSFRPVVPPDTGAIFYIHLFLVSVLAAYFPFSKLMHAPGLFLSPTRNLKNDSRAKRHVNPWDYPVVLHTYEEWEDEFREAMKEAGLPLEKE